MNDSSAGALKMPKTSTGHRHGMETLQESGLQHHQGTPETAGDLRRPQPVRACRHQSIEHRVLRDWAG
jgi:hypothetical protein